MKKQLLLILILSSSLTFPGDYPDSAFYAVGGNQAHKEMLDKYMAGPVRMAAKNECYLKERKSTIAYGKSYWLAAKDNNEKKQREAYLLELEAPTHLERCRAYSNAPLAPEPLFTQGTFEIWEKLKPQK